MALQAADGAARSDFVLLPNAASVGDFLSGSAYVRIISSVDVPFIEIRECPGLSDSCRS
jgi:hypothetical protein